MASFCPGNGMGLGLIGICWRSVGPEGRRLRRYMGRYAESNRDGGGGILVLLRGDYSRGCRNPSVHAAHAMSCS